MTWPAGNGEMAALVRTHDWASTSLGPADGWPSALKAIVELTLASPLVSTLALTDERLFIYNDAAAALYGGRHPGALGRPLAEVFADSYSAVAHAYDRVFAGESVTVAAQPLAASGEASGEIFDAYLTPVRAADGSVFGAHMTGIEIGDRVRAAAALSESERKYRLLFNSIDEGFCIIEMLFDEHGTPADYRFLEINSVFEQHTGLKDAVGKTIREMLPNHEQHWFDIFGRIALTGEAERFENEAAELGRWYDVFAFKVGAAEQRLVAVLFRDINERRRADRALREREAELARTQLIGQVASVDVTLNEALIGHRSLEYRRLHGLPPDRAVESHEDWLARIHPEDRERANDAFVSAVENGDIYESEYRIIRPSDGETRWISARGLIECDAQGKAARLLGAHTDITERKQADAALRASETRLRVLVQGMPQLVWRAVDEGQWTWASPQWTEYSGLTDEASRGQGWLEAVHPDDRGGAMEIWGRAEKEGAFHCDYRLWHVHEKRYRWFQTRASPVCDDDGKVIEWLGTSTDVDDLRGLQDRQRILVAELQHRVRNILAVVRSVFARTAEAGDDIEDVVRHFQGRLDSLARTQVIVTRSAEGTADLQDLIRDELMSVGAGNEIAYKINGPDVTLKFETAEMIGLAIHELTTNSLKYGALRFEKATLDINWEVNVDKGGTRKLNFTWIEHGVPMVPLAPRHGGFGRELIEEALPYRTGARTSIEFRGGGIRCHISLPLPAAKDSSAQT